MMSNPALHMADADWGVEKGKNRTQKNILSTGPTRCALVVLICL